PVGAIAGLEQRLDLDLEQLPPLCGGTGRSVQPLVVARPRYLQPAPHPVDGGSTGRGVLDVDERVFVAHRGSLAKYAAAFFRKAFSISSSRFWRSNSRSRARSDNSTGGASLACASR